MMPFIHFSRSKLANEKDIFNLFDKIEKMLNIKLPQMVAIKVAQDIEFEKMTVNGKPESVLVLNYPGYTFLSDQELEFAIVFAAVFYQVKESHKPSSIADIHAKLDKIYTPDEKINAWAMLQYYSNLYGIIIRDVKNNTRSIHLLSQMDHTRLTELGAPNLKTIALSVCSSGLKIPATNQNIQKVLNRYQSTHANCIYSQPSIKRLHQKLITEGIFNSIDDDDSPQSTITFLATDDSLDTRIWNFLNGDSSQHNWCEIKKISVGPFAGCDYEQIDNGKSLNLKIGFPGVLTMSNWELKYHSNFWKALIKNIGSVNLIQDTVRELSETYTYEQIFFTEMNQIYHEVLYKKYITSETKNVQFRTPIDTQKIFLELETQMLKGIPMKTIPSLIRATERLLSNAKVVFKIDHKKLETLIEKNRHQNNIFRSLPTVSSLRERFACQVYLASRDSKEGKRKAA